MLKRTSAFSFIAIYDSKFNRSITIMVFLALKGYICLYSRAHAGIVVSYLAGFGPGPPPDVVGEGAALSI